MKTIMAQEQSIDKLTQSGLRQITQFLKECQKKELRLDEVEQGLFERLMALGGSLLKGFVQEAGDGDAGPTLPGQQKNLRRSQEKHRRWYRSIFGVFEVRRYVYAEREGRKIEALPLDQKLGLPAGEQSYVLEDWVNRLTTHVAYEQAVRWLDETLKIQTTVRAAEGMVAKASRFLEGFRQTRGPVGAEEEGEFVVVTADGKGVPIRRPLEQRLQEELGKKPHKRNYRVTYEKASQRRSRGDKKVRKQMASVGVVYSVDRWDRTAEEVIGQVDKSEQDRPPLKNRRYWAEMTQVIDGEVSRGTQRLFGHLAEEVASRDPDGRRPLVCLIDGDKSLWEQLRRHLPQAVGIVDIYHVMEKLWKAAHCFHPECSKDAQQFVTRYLRMLLEGNVGCVIGVFRRFRNQRSLTKAKRKDLEAVIRYFDTYRDAMRYDQYLGAGYPIGSGVVEGACRHVVADRMENTGMRWEIEGAQSILNLRTTYLTGEWSAFHQHRIQTEQTALYGTSA